MDFPFADAASIIRTNQKDLFVENDLHSQIRDVLQGLKGVRFTHNWSKEIQAFTTALYLGLTTLIGSRTLGEEYTDVFYLTADRAIPSSLRVGLYVLTSGLAPLVIPKIAKKLQGFLRKLRQRRTGGENDEYDDQNDEEESAGFLERILTPATMASINLTIFYFNGAYYQLLKRFVGLRYAFGHRVDPLSQPSGSYELIGMLMITRGLYEIVAEVKKHFKSPEEDTAKMVNVKEVGISLDDETVFPFIRDESRRCNLCLENMRAPTVTLCGHMYCWSCIAEWCRDQSECPLCRQECQEQHLLCLRV